MKKTLTALALVLSLAFPLAFAVPTVQQVKQSMTSSNWQKADSQLSEVLQAHLNNAYAHYLYAQVLGREGRYSDALSQLQQAKSADPSLSFTDPSKFAETQARIQSHAQGGTRASTTANPFNQGSQAAAASQKHGPSMGMWVGLIVLIGAIALVLRWGLKRARTRDDGQANDDRRAQIKRATELLNDVRTLKLDVRLSAVPGHEARLKDVEAAETQLRKMVEELSNSKNPLPPYAIEDMENRVASLKARAEGRPDPNATENAPQGNGGSAYAQEAERWGRNQQQPYPPQGQYPQQQGQQGPVIIQQGSGCFGGGMGGLLTGVLLGEAMSHGRDRVIEREVPVERRDDNNGGLDFGNGSNDWNGGGLDLGSNDDNWRDT
ncbi:TPR repeat [Candidatus Burkholderia pumila]|uniref:TPR repeat n=1 Tax=Candidatus Burkholderia pumila TaxID=1090375 RepID=A0ABR5HML1_9BURK|nr:TPR repeat [Candidatus Burkholderia pumila]